MSKGSQANGIEKELVNTPTENIPIIIAQKDIKRFEAIYTNLRTGEATTPLSLDDAKKFRKFLRQKQQRYKNALQAIGDYGKAKEPSEDNAYTALQGKLQREIELLPQCIEAIKPQLESNDAEIKPSPIEKQDEQPLEESSRLASPSLTRSEELLVYALDLSTVAGAQAFLQEENARKKEKQSKDSPSPENGFGDNPISEEALQEKATAYTVLLGEALKTPADLGTFLEEHQDEDTAPAALHNVWTAYQEIKGQPENNTKTDNELLVEAVDLVWARHRAVSEMIVNEARSLLDNSTTLSATDKTAAHEALNKLLPLIDKSVLLGEAPEAKEWNQKVEGLKDLGIDGLLTWEDTILNPEERAATIQKHYADLEGYNRIPGYPYLFTLKEPANANDNSLEHILARDFKDIYPDFDEDANKALPNIADKEQSKALLAQLAITALRYQVYTKEGQAARKAELVQEYKRQRAELAGLLGEEAVDAFLAQSFSGSPDVSQAIAGVVGESIKEAIIDHLVAQRLRGRWFWYRYLYAKGIRNTVTKAVTEAFGDIRGDDAGAVSLRELTHLLTDKKKRLAANQLEDYITQLQSHFHQYTQKRDYAIWYKEDFNKEQELSKVAQQHIGYILVQSEALAQLPFEAIEYLLHQIVLPNKVEDATNFAEVLDERCKQLTKAHKSSIAYLLPKYTDGTPKKTHPQLVQAVKSALARDDKRVLAYLSEEALDWLFAQHKPQEPSRDIDSDIKNLLSDAEAFSVTTRVITLGVSKALDKKLTLSEVSAALLESDDKNKMLLRLSAEEIVEAFGTWQCNTDDTPEANVKAFYEHCKARYEANKKSKAQQRLKEAYEEKITSIVDHYTLSLNNNEPISKTQQKDIKEPLPQKDLNALPLQGIQYLLHRKHEALRREESPKQFATAFKGHLRTFQDEYDANVNTIIAHGVAQRLRGRWFWYRLFYAKGIRNTVTEAVHEAFGDITGDGLGVVSSGELTRLLTRRRKRLTATQLQGYIVRLKGRFQQYTQNRDAILLHKNSSNDGQEAPKAQQILESLAQCKALSQLPLQAVQRLLAEVMPSLTTVATAEDPIKAFLDRCKEVNKQHRSNKVWLQRSCMQKFYKVKSLPEIQHIVTQFLNEADPERLWAELSKKEMGKLSLKVGERLGFYNVDSKNVDSKYIKRYLQMMYAEAKSYIPTRNTSLIHIQHALASKMSTKALLQADKENILVHLSENDVACVLDTHRSENTSEPVVEAFYERCKAFCETYSANVKLLVEAFPFLALTTEQLGDNSSLISALDQHTVVYHLEEVKEKIQQISDNLGLLLDQVQQNEPMKGDYQMNLVTYFTALVEHFRINPKIRRIHYVVSYVNSLRNETTKFRNDEVHDITQTLVRADMDDNILTYLSNNDIKFVLERMYSEDTQRSEVFDADQGKAFYISCKNFYDTYCERKKEIKRAVEENCNISPEEVKLVKQLVDKIDKHIIESQHQDVVSHIQTTLQLLPKQNSKYNSWTEAITKAFDEHVIEPFRKTHLADTQPLVVPQRSTGLSTVSNIKV